MKNIYFTIISLFCIIFSVNATVHIINVEDNEFSPSFISVIVGDTVRWKWDNSASAHTTTSISVPFDALTWDNPIDNANTSFDYIVTKAGTYNYECTFHAAMGMTGSFTATGTTAINNSVSSSFFTINTIVVDVLEITVNLSYAEFIQLYLFDINGILIKDFGSANHESGLYSESYSVNEIPKGMYLLKLQAGDSNIVKKIMIQ